MHAIKPYPIIEVITHDVTTAASSVAINNKTFMVENAGAAPIYINPKTEATTTNGFMIPANTIINQVFTADGNMSVIGGGASTLKFLILDI